MVYISNVVYQTKHYITLKIKGQMLKKRCIKKYYSCDKTSIFSFTKNILLELFQKTNNCLQLFIKTSLTFYASTGVCLQNNVWKGKNIIWVILNKFLCKSVQVHTSATAYRVVKWLIFSFKIIMNAFQIWGKLKLVERKFLILHWKKKKK